MLTRCPECDEKIRVHDDDVGAAIVCPMCKHEIRLRKPAKPAPAKAERAYCPFCGKKFKTSRPGGSEVLCPGCKCKFKLPLSTDTEAIDPVPEADKSTPNPAGKAFLDDIERQLAEKKDWRKWNEERRKYDVFHGSTVDDRPWGRYGWLGYILWRLFG